jgi:hypothetical protein
MNVTFRLRLTKSERYLADLDKVVCMSITWVQLDVNPTQLALIA